MVPQVTRSLLCCFILKWVGPGMPVNHQNVKFWRCSFRHSREYNCGLSIFAGLPSPFILSIFSRSRCCSVHFFWTPHWNTLTLKKAGPLKSRKLARRPTSQNKCRIYNRIDDLLTGGLKGRISSDLLAKVSPRVNRSDTDTAGIIGVCERWCMHGQIGTVQVCIY